MKAVSAEQMAEIDRRAQSEYGMPQSLLMENAGRSAAELIARDLSPLKDEKVLVLCGKGNNGGDGFVIARYFAQLSPAKLTIYVTDLFNVRPGAALENLDKIKKMGLDIRPIEDLSASGGIGGFTVAVDALFGTGFRGELPENCRRAGEELRTSNIRTYAIDVPSGLNATNGEAAEGCVEAFKTITFGLPKKGFYLNEGPRCCGEITVTDIGFPDALLEPYL